MVKEKKSLELTVWNRFWGELRQEREKAGEWDVITAGERVIEGNRKPFMTLDYRHSEGREDKVKSNQGHQPE